MRTFQLPSILAAALIASAGTLAAQDTRGQAKQPMSDRPAMGNQPPAKQAARPEAGESSGHDARTGKPETAGGPNGQRRDESSTDGKTPTTAQSPLPATTTPDIQRITLTDSLANYWIDKRVFSVDGKELGEVAAFKRAPDNTVLEMHADIGGLLGIGETRVSVTPEQFHLRKDRVDLTVTEEQAKALPKVK
jgi:hypothetical protein